MSKKKSDYKSQTLTCLPIWRISGQFGWFWKNAAVTHFNLAVSPLPMLSTLYCSAWASGPVRTDSSAKQKSIGLLADGWGSTLSQTLSLCSRPVRHPSCEWTHCAHSVSLCVNLRRPLIMCEEGKSSLGQSGTSSPFEVARIYSFSPELQTWVRFFPCYLSPQRPSTIPTRGNSYIYLFVSDAFLQIST